jgi:4-hydroxybenzoate polyprenyltransferase
MLSLFDLLDRAFDTLAHGFDDRHAPKTPRSRPQVALFLLALALVPIALVLGWEGSPWLFGVLGLMGAIVFAALFVIWDR